MDHTPYDICAEQIFGIGGKPPYKYLDWRADKKYIISPPFNESQIPKPISKFLLVKVPIIIKSHEKRYGNLLSTLTSLHWQKYNNLYCRRLNINTSQLIGD